MRLWIAIWVGSTAICRAIAAWIAGGVALRLTLIALAAGFIKGLRWTTDIVCFGAAVWFLVAVIIGARSPVTLAVLKQATPGPAPEPCEEPAAEVTAEAAEEPPALTHERLVQALHAVGAPHAHTSALADHLGAPAEAVREALRAAGIPLSGGVRMKGRPVVVSPGVKAGDFPPLPSPTQATAEEEPVAGVLTSNNNSNNADEPDPEEGPTIVQDEDNPHRWRVLRARS
ncbi:hypothetical protein [Streptomyces neyagawaensis]|uniref:hypothetical protein n=1 Tax=Streptomyces neyagawaensis TaxID=42238 RepID=UPI00201D1A22|nr:hypothetical protein [Streptomyces neyagawaensis]MCL6733312.1 hypothetical protein [Streptomyces neyagawaensis]MDE1685114.1 hypothetical protein [Streptomyces neyagawaensis]